MRGGFRGSISHFKAPFYVTLSRHEWFQVFKTIKILRGAQNDKFMEYGVLTWVLKPLTGRDLRQTPYFSGRGFFS